MGRDSIHKVSFKSGFAFNTVLTDKCQPFWVIPFWVLHLCFVNITRPKLKLSRERLSCAAYDVAGLKYLFSEREQVLIEGLFFYRG